MCISDTHNRYKELTIPECDILIDSGDYSFRGTDSEITNFYRWLNKQPAKYIISVQGNHELGWEKDPTKCELLAWKECERVKLLHDSAVEIEGIKFWGSPWQPEFFNWAFNLPRGEKLSEKWSLIPEDTNFLITHSPPYQILDEVINRDIGKISSAGCMDLRERVDKLLNLKYHQFGHLHRMGGKQMTIVNTNFINAAMNDDQYKITRKPIVIQYD